MPPSSCTPALAERAGFQLDRRGHYRSAYPVSPALPAAATAAVVSGLGWVDLGAALAAGFVAKLTASMLTAAAVVVTYFSAARQLGPTRAVWLALGLGLGTNYWATASQTLWQHDSAALGLAGVVYVVGPSFKSMGTSARWGAAFALGIAVSARPQLALTAGTLACALIVYRRRISDWLALTPLLLIAAVVLGLNLVWFGHPLGAVPRLEALHSLHHEVSGSLNPEPWKGVVGLLLSPSRGLLVHSPIVLVACLGAAWGWNQKSGPRWFLIAAGVQLVAYGSYSVWWGGHTYGPRYALDVLPLLVPAAAEGIRRAIESPALRVGLAAALVWSVVLAATGAWCYPHERWNTRPLDVDRNHARLWDWSDPQFLRCWRAGLSPQNFAFFEAGALSSSGRTVSERLR